MRAGKAPATEADPGAGERQAASKRKHNELLQRARWKRHCLSSVRGRESDPLPCAKRRAGRAG
jgi:hypothetical protein